MKQYEWFEQLPPSCPPADAKECSGVFYRVASGDPTRSEDFFSQRKLAPEKTYKGEGVDECIARAVSVFADEADARRLLKLPKFRHSCIAEMKLSANDGKTKKTFRASHYSWWRSIDFNVATAKVIGTR